jgi:hypothetical protein
VKNYKHKKVMLFMALVLTLIVAFGSVTAASSALKIVVDGKEINVKGVSIQNNQVVVPLRAFMEAMGANVHWDPATRTVYITTSGLAPIRPPASSAPTVGKESFPNWVEMHIKQGALNVVGTGLSQKAGSDDFIKAIQARSPGGFNPQTCVVCHTDVGPGTFIYGNPNFRKGAMDWSPMMQYDKTAADDVNVPKPSILDAVRSKFWELSK